MNILLRRFVVILTLIHPLFSIYVLNIIFVMCFHEALHLSVERKIRGDSNYGKVVLRPFSISVVFEELPSVKSVLAPLFIGPIGLVFSYIMKSLNFNLNLIFYLHLLSLPWILNCINILWFSPDMKTLRRVIKNL